MISVSPLEKFIGRDCSVIQESELNISNNIRCQKLEVAYPNGTLPEEGATFYFFPIDEVSYCVQLCYLMQNDNAGRDFTVYSITYFPSFFEQFQSMAFNTDFPLNSQKKADFQFYICAKSAGLLMELSKGDGNRSFNNLLHANQAVINLLNRALESITVPFTVCQVPACRFLAYESEREKIQEAITLLGRQVGKVLSIKELARKVAMNECYLKKGFKAITGKTIHEYQQDLRINKAKELLQHEGYTVTAVAEELGFSSIAHFSTVFKRVTGLKPCELLS